mgnify:CR=1 FL=1
MVIVFNRRISSINNCTAVTIRKIYVWKYFRVNYLNPAIEQGFVALTIPDKPTSSKQQYYLTDKGKEFLKTLK